MLTQYICIHKDPSTSFTQIIGTSFDLYEAIGLSLHYAHKQMEDLSDENAKIEFTPFFVMEQETGWIAHFNIISDQTVRTTEDLIILKNEMTNSECDKLIEDVRKYNGVSDE